MPRQHSAAVARHPLAHCISLQAAQLYHGTLRRARVPQVHWIRQPARPAQVHLQVIYLFADLEHKRQAHTQSTKQEPTNKLRNALTLKGLGSAQRARVRRVLSNDSCRHT